MRPPGSLARRAVDAHCAIACSTNAARTPAGPGQVEALDVPQHAIASDSRV